MENRDYLKEYVEANRAAFEEGFNAQRLWKDIETEITPPVKPLIKKLPIKWMSIAASVLLLVGTGFFMGRSGVNTASYAEAPYADMDQHYTQQVSLLVTQAKNNSEVDQSVFDDIKFLDVQYQELLTEYNEVESDSRKELLLSAMINNYRMRIDMLNHVLLKIKTSKNGNNLHVEEIKI